MRSEFEVAPKNPTVQRVVGAVVIAVLALLALRDIARLGNDLPWRVTYDLADFYCAGEAVNEARSPYTYEPLRTCEHRVVDSPDMRANPSLARPAPQPPYDLPVFSMLAKLPYAAAQQLWSMAIVVALGVTAFALRRMGVPWGIAIGSLVLSAGFEQMYLGQIVPFALCALAVCGWMLADRRDALAGVFAGLTAIEPHLGAPVVLAALLFVPRARASLVVTAAIAIVASTLAFGPQTWIVYLSQVLPAHAWSELGFPMQFSFTYALHVLGASNRFALVAGEASFAIAVLLGLACARPSSERLQRRELLVFLPAAMAVTGGVFVHAVELCFAIPAAIVFALYAPGRCRLLGTAALAALTIPWMQVWGIKKLWAASVAVVAAIAYGAKIERWFAISLTVAFAAGLYLLERVPPSLPAARTLAANAFAPNSLVQVEWQALIASVDVHDIMWLAVKLPAWCALIAILAIALRCAVGRAPQSQPLP